mmetsp:Transcript_16543/g.33552  ORF Transcript_16543/g.33552 Transcript_16543/m.33552 type:complete len:216 (-) Transcript_16543:24-671(-)
MHGHVNTTPEFPSSTALPSLPKTANEGSLEVTKTKRVPKRKMNHITKKTEKQATRLAASNRALTSPPMMALRFAISRAFCATALSNSLAKSASRMDLPSAAKSGIALASDFSSRPEATMRDRVALDSSGSEKSTNHEFTPSFTNSKCPCAGCTATGVPEQKASMTVLPRVSKFEAETKRSAAAYAKRSSGAFSIFRSGRTFFLPDSAPACATRAA